MMIVGAFTALPRLLPAQNVSARSTRVAAIDPDSLVWSGRNPSVQFAKVEGDPMVPDAPYSLAIKLAGGAWIQPHWHPRDQHVVVLRGTLLLGGGDAIDTLTALSLPRGSLASIPAQAHHAEGGKGETVIVIYGIGPMTTTFVRPPAH